MSKKTQNDSEDFFMNTDGDQISMIAEITTEPEGDDVLKMEFDKEFPVMPLRNMVMFPHVVMPVTIGRASTLKLINAAFKKKLPIILACQVSAEVDDPGYADLYHGRDRPDAVRQRNREYRRPGDRYRCFLQLLPQLLHCS